jgi:serine/threonine protein kinase
VFRLPRRIELTHFTNTSSSSSFHTQRGDIKLFDFGMARELHDDDRLQDGTYQLTHMTGSLRYMAPEVAMGHTYNDRADVYSFTVLLWEMLALERPSSGSKGSRNAGGCATKSLELHLEQVCVCHMRPPISSTWTDATQDILRHGWAETVPKRYGMQELSEMLRLEVVNLRNGNDTGLGDARRRSTYVFDDALNDEESMREIAMLAAASNSDRSLFSVSESPTQSEYSIDEPSREHLTVDP